MLSSKQQEFLDNCSRRWNVKTGATGSGKTWLDYAVVIPQRLLALRGEGAAVILGNTQGTANRNILEPMRDIWGDALVGTINSNDNSARLFGKKVYVMGADNKKHVARIQGMDDKALKIVRDYIIEHLDKSAPEPKFEVYMVWKAKALQNWKYLISSTLLDGMYYELTYNGDKQEWYLDAYKKFENRVIPA